MYYKATQQSLRQLFPLYLALKVTAVNLVASVSAVVIVVTSPVHWNALAVIAAHLTLRTCTIRTFANILMLIRVVSAVILKVTKPTSGKCYI